MSVRSKHTQFDGMHSRWLQCRHAFEGEYAIHEQADLYLPRLTDEDDTAYRLRKSMTPWFNATRRTILGMRGMLLRKPPAIKAPAVLTPFLTDLDASGSSLFSVCSRVITEALTVGRVGVLLDYPMVPDGLTQADVKTLNLRPILGFYRAESIYNWATTCVNGVVHLTQVRLVEKELTQKDEFTSESMVRYKVLDLHNGRYRQRVYTVNEKDEEIQLGDDVFPTQNGQPMSEIPFIFIGVDELSFEVESPPLLDLVTTNFHHYRQATSYERGCFFSGLPTMFVSGMTSKDGPISLGGKFANALSSPDAKAYYVEVSSKFEALRTNLEDKKREMAVLGARLLESQRPGVEAAETVARRQNGEESILSTIAQTISDGLSRTLSQFVLWLGSTEPVQVTINRDFFPQAMTSSELSALVSAWQQGAISKQTLFNNLKQGEVIDPGTSFEDEESQIITYGPQI